MRRLASLVLVCIASLVVGPPAHGSVQDAARGAGAPSSKVVFHFQGKTYSGATLRRLSSSTHCVPAARADNFTCYATRHAARTAYRMRTRTEGGAAAAIPAPPDVTLINNDIGPRASIMLPFFEVPRLSDYGWNNRADVVKIDYTLQIQYKAYKQKEYWDFLSNMAKGSNDVANNLISSFRAQ